LTEPSPNSAQLSYEPAEMPKKVLDLATTLYACGIDMKRTTLFVQSEVPGHADLTWLFNTITPLGELERMTRRYTAEIIDFLGPERDVPAPDVNTNEKVMAWIMDTYSMHARHLVTAVVTGKPMALGGSRGRPEATGRGCMIVILKALELLGLKPQDARVVIQGFGNVGGMASKLMSAIGFKIVCVVEYDGAVYNANGLDIAALQQHRRETGSITGFAGGEDMDKDEAMFLECEVLIPAATENVIHSGNADRIRCKILCEGANGPTTPLADEVLADKKITDETLADIIAYGQPNLGMQPFGQAYGGTLSPSDIDSIVTFMRYTWDDRSVLPAGATLAGGIPVLKPGEVPSYDVHIGPFVTHYCVSCHSAGKVNDNYLLTSYKDMLNSGDNAPVLSAGDSQSLLLKLITGHTGVDPKTGQAIRAMPPTKLLDQQYIDMITEWVMAGMPQTAQQEAKAPTPTPKP